MFRILILLSFLYSISFSCGGGYWPEDYELRFLQKRNYEFANITGDLNSVRNYNDLIYDYKKVIKKKNIEEWSSYFKNKYTKKQIEEIVYNNKNLNLLKDKEVKTYLDFLHKQSKLVADDSWWYKYNRKRLKDSNFNFAINKALEQIKVTKSKYLKLRYFFLALRISHYNNIGDTLGIYENYKYLLKDKENTIVKDWIQGLYAGALIKNDQIVKGVYEFTKLFGKNKLNWYLAYYNFKYIKTDKQWNDLLALAKNKDEKIKFFTIRALNAKANVIEEVKNIMDINKNSKFVDLLLFRKLLSSQTFFDLPYWENDTKEKIDYKPYINFLKTIKKENMYMVHLSLAFFNFYDDNYKSSSVYLKKAYQEVKGDNVDELNALKYIIYLNKLKKIDNNVENELGKKLEKLVTQPCNKRDIHKYTFNKIKNIYKKQNDKFKYFLTDNIDQFYIDLVNLSRYNQIKALENKKNKTVLERYIINYKKKDRYFAASLNAAYFKILINNLKFQEALNYLKTQKKNIKDYELWNKYSIFNAFIRGNNRVSVDDISYDVVKMLKKLIKIKKNLKTNPNSTMDNYLYATALYNLSYFGNANVLTTVYRSNYEFKEKKLELKKINLSIKHFNQALKTAKNKNFRAKIVYMLAKSELALYDINFAKNIVKSSIKRYESKRSYGWYGNRAYKNYIINGYGKYLNELKNKYKNTSYYSELIEECGNIVNYYNYKNNLLSYENSIKENISNKYIFLKNIENYIKENDKKSLKKYDQIYLFALINNIKITKKTVTTYNNIAYFLYKKYKMSSAKFVLNKILEKFPNRAVALYNIADIYYYDYDYDSAKKYYKKYVEEMKKMKKENKIPKKVFKRI